MIRNPRRNLGWLALGSALLATLALVAGPTDAGPAAPADGKLRADLPDVLAGAAANELVPISIVLAAQVPREEIEALSRTADSGLRRELVKARLVEIAEATQPPLLRLLERGRTRGEVGPRIRPLWLSNVIAADVTPDLARAIGARDDVAWVSHNPKRDISLGMAAVGGSPPTCGVELVRAPEVWDQFGTRGEGVVVAVIDSGVCYTHPDIESNIWVNPGEDLDQDGEVFDLDDVNGTDDDGNGFVDDLIGWNFAANNLNPNDSFGHGTHVAGTVAGDGTSGSQTGVAPGAEVMPIKVGLTFSDEMDVWNAMQYAADMDADVISMSLGWPHSVAPDRATWRTNCDNVLAMGTVMVIAAGNEADCCRPFDAVRTPGDVPAVITVGAVDCSDTVAGFSSRGPVTWQDVPPFNDHPYPPGLIKPTIAGPGVNTESLAVCSGYTLSSGTSMATPHTSGAVALMLSANPSLTPELVKLLLRDTAVDLGELGPDNDSGSGRIDAFRAVEAASDPATPTVFFVDPDHAPNTVPTSVEIHGENFIGDIEVRFGGVRAPFVQRIDGETLLTSTPAFPRLGEVDVNVSTTFGSDTLAAGLGYEPSLAVISTDVTPGEEVRFFAGGPFGGDWGLLMDTQAGSAVFKGFTLCLARSGDFRVVDHSRRTPRLVLNESGHSVLRYTVPEDTSPGDRFLFQALFDGNGPEPGAPIFGTDCLELRVVSP